jgi:hypothetical protein
MSDEDGFRLEQHIGTIMQIMVVGLLAWSLKTNIEMTTQVGILNVKVEALSATVNQGTQDRYRGSDAAKDFAGVWAEFKRVDTRLNKLESRRNP